MVVGVVVLEEEEEEVEGVAAPPNGKRSYGK